MVLTEQEKKRLISTRVDLLGLGVGTARDLFPPIDGIEQKVKLRAKKEGEYYHIPFFKSNNLENVIYGNIANKLLQDFPNMFDIIEVNGRPHSKGAEDIKEMETMEKIMNLIQQKYDLVPKKQDTARNLHNNEPTEAKTDYTKDELKNKPEKKKDIYSKSK